MSQVPGSSVADAIETASQDQLRSVQLEGLQQAVEAARQTELYGDRLDGVEITSLEDVRELPLTTKSDLQTHGYRATMVRDPTDVVEYHTSSGTTGEPTVMALTEADLERSREVLARTWRMHGIAADDLVQMMVSYGLFTAGHLNQYAIQHLGAGVVPAGIQSSTEQIEYMDRLEPTYLVAVSSYYLRLAHVARTEGHELPDVDGLVGGGVPLSESAREYVEDAFDAPFYDQYGLAEINTGLAGECECQDGLHLQADYAYPEIVDPETHEPLPEGERGVLVLTTLGRDGQVVLRYVTGDLTSIRYGQCECGRTLPRIDPIEGRADDVVFVRGTKLGTSALQSRMEALDDVIDPFQWRLQIDRKEGRDHLTVFAEWWDDPEPETLREHLTQELGLTIDEVRSLDEAAGAEHKLNRIRDLR